MVIIRTLVLVGLTALLPLAAAAQLRAHSPAHDMSCCATPAGDALAAAVLLPAPEPAAVAPCCGPPPQPAPAQTVTGHDGHQAAAPPATTAHGACPHCAAARKGVAPSGAHAHQGGCCTGKP